MFGDLHCHTRLSDGSLGIDEIIAYAKRMGLSFLSITDHDTMAGVSRAVVLGKRYGIEVIPELKSPVPTPQQGASFTYSAICPRFPKGLKVFFTAYRNSAK